jgi:hypothetical protein
MARWLAEARRHPFRSLGPVALVALVPKCGLCLLAYLGLGAAFGLSAREMCGAVPGHPALWITVVALGLAGIGTAALFRRNS